jgi:hypothetical protein
MARTAGAVRLLPGRNAGDRLTRKEASDMLEHMIRRGFTVAQAAAVAREMSIDLECEGIALEAFREGMDVELEHGRRHPETNVTDDDPIMTGKIALAHLREFSDYYARLAVMERDALSDRESAADHLWVLFEHQA